VLLILPSQSKTKATIEETINYAKRYGYILNMVLSPLPQVLGFLSDNYLNGIQNNTVVVQQGKMDRVGVEPTTSAMPATFSADYPYHTYRGMQRL
jgi:hypothetical protein